MKKLSKKDTILLSISAILLMIGATIWFKSRSNIAPNQQLPEEMPTVARTPVKEAMMHEEIVASRQPEMVKMTVKRLPFGAPIPL